MPFNLMEQFVEMWTEGVTCTSFRTLYQLLPVYCYATYHMMYIPLPTGVQTTEIKGKISEGHGYVARQVVKNFHAGTVIPF